MPYSEDEIKRMVKKILRLLKFSTEKEIERLGTDEACILLHNLANKSVVYFKPVMMDLLCKKLDKLDEEGEKEELHLAYETFFKIWMSRRTEVSSEMMKEAEKRIYGEELYNSILKKRNAVPR